MVLYLKKLTLNHTHTLTTGDQKSSLELNFSSGELKAGGTYSKQYVQSTASSLYIF